MDRKNINRGFKKLRVWQDAVSLYVLAFKTFNNFPFELKKVAGNSIDAAHRISRNISEGYCRRSLKEYLNHLNIMNRKSGLNLLVHGATGAIQQWARDIMGMRMGILIVIHTFGADMKWHPHIHLIVTGERLP